MKFEIENFTSLYYNEVMHPLSVFPQLLYLGLLAPFVLRLCVGLFIMYLGNERRGKEHSWLAVVYFLSGILLILGFYTQIAVLVSIALLIFNLYTEKVSMTKDRKFLYIIVGTILLSLLFTGPGFLAFDLLL